MRAPSGRAVLRLSASAASATTFAADHIQDASCDTRAYIETTITDQIRKFNAIWKTAMRFSQEVLSGEELAGLCGSAFASRAELPSAAAGGVAVWQDVPCKCQRCLP